ncbi:hypothetical protein [Paenibacillus sp. 1P07SE]|uniref:hypothetical protein n=1 Tax=Paenibacillus sp. 1P07SE TaxID=3132209 RepID=UPI0039A588B8
MSNQSSTVTREAMTGMASGVMFMALFGTMWAFTGFGGLQVLGSTALITIPLLPGTTLFMAGLFLVRTSRRLPPQADTTDAAAGKKTKRLFNLIFAVQGIAIAITVLLCVNTGRSELIPIIIALIVGLHFFPLARLFQVRLYYGTGGLLCLAAVATWLFLPAELTIGDYEIATYLTVTGFSSAIILWGSGLAIWRMGRLL